MDDEALAIDAGRASHRASLALFVGAGPVPARRGRGGFGSVCLARDDELGRLVAIKVLQPGVLRGLGQAESFLAEARITAGRCGLTSSERRVRRPAGRSDLSGGGAHPAAGAGTRRHPSGCMLLTRVARSSTIERQRGLRLQEAPRAGNRG
jgi:hypothetical protein